jgi:hypothetical protein
MGGYNRKMELRTDNQAFSSFYEKPDYSKAQEIPRQAHWNTHNGCEGEYAWHLGHRYRLNTLVHILVDAGSSTGEIIPSTCGCRQLVFS